MTSGLSQSNSKTNFPDKNPRLSRASLSCQAILETLRAGALPNRKACPIIKCCNENGSGISRRIDDVRDLRNISTHHQSGRGNLGKRSPAPHRKSLSARGISRPTALAQFVESLFYFPKFFENFFFRLHLGFVFLNNDINDNSYYHIHQYHGD